MERRITETEREVLRLHGAGLPPHEIAARLGISDTTVAWIVANIVGEWGARRTDDLALALASARRGRWVAQFALPVAVMGVLTLATVLVLGATGTLHGPLATPNATPSPTASGGTGPSTTKAPPAADGDGAKIAQTAAPQSSNAPALPTVAPVVPTIVPPLPTIPPVLPTLAPIVPTIPPVIPTIGPTVAPSLPLPPLPTVPPLPTPHLPPL